MIDSFDIYAIGDNESEWLCDTKTLDQALQLVQKVGPGTYLVFSKKTEWYDFCLVGSDGELSQVQKQSDTVN